MSTSAPILLTREQCRQVDRYAIEVLGIPGVVLMENAGRNAAEHIVQILRARSAATPARPLRCAIVCGKGNNGGDGFVVARHLLRHEYAVTVWLAADPAGLTGDAARNYTPLEKLGVRRVPIAEPSAADQAALEWEHCDVVVDALLGTGFEGQVREPLAGIIERINALSGPIIVALDVPSGMDANTGQVHGAAIEADHTITFLAAKPGLLLPAARQFVGQLTVADIGIPLKQVLETISPVVGA
jgi:NAD(P)H-hydrate epimerase